MSTFHALGSARCRPGRWVFGQLWATVFIPMRFLAPHAPSPGQPQGSLRASVDGIHTAARFADASFAAPGSPSGLNVPIVVQERERCGQAALQMVLRYYGADSAALRMADSAYDPVLRGSLITDLATAARRAGYIASVATLTPDSLIALLADGIPPIVLYQNGRGPFTVGHFGVVTNWNPRTREFSLNDGSSRPRRASRDDLARRWKTAGSQALLVRRRIQ